MKDIFSKLLLSLALIINLGFSPVVYGMKDSNVSTRSVREYNPGCFKRFFNWALSGLYDKKTGDEKLLKECKELVDESDRLYGTESEGNGDEVEGEGDFDFDEQEEGSEEDEEDEGEEEEVEGESDSEEEEEMQEDNKTLVQLTRTLPEEVQLLILSFLVQLHQNAEQYVANTVDMRNGEYEKALEEIIERITSQEKKINPAFGDYLEKVRENITKAIEQTREDEKCVVIKKEKETTHNQRINEMTHTWKDCDLTDFSETELWEIIVYIFLYCDNSLREQFIEKVNNLVDEYFSNYDEFGIGNLFANASSLLFAFEKSEKKEKVKNTLSYVFSQLIRYNLGRPLLLVLHNKNSKKTLGIIGEFDLINNSYQNSEILKFLLQKQNNFPLAFESTEITELLLKSVENVAHESNKVNVFEKLSKKRILCLILKKGIKDLVVSLCKTVGRTSRSVCENARHFAQLIGHLAINSAHNIRNFVVNNRIKSAIGVVGILMIWFYIAVKLDNSNISDDMCMKDDYSPWLEQCPDYFRAMVDFRGLASFLRFLLKGMSNRKKLKITRHLEKYCLQPFVDSFKELSFKEILMKIYELMHFGDKFENVDVNRVFL